MAAINSIGGQLCTPKSAPRRRHGAEFKAKVPAACDEPGASTSGVALCMI